MRKYLGVMVVCVAVSAFAGNDKRVYVGARAGFGIGMSSPGEELKDMITDDESAFKSGGNSFDIAPFVSLQLANAFAIQTELLFTQYGHGGFKMKKDSEYSYYEVYKKGDYVVSSRPAMVIPILPKLTLAEGKFCIFAGPHFSVNMGDFKAKAKINGNKTSVKMTKDETKELSEDMKNPVGLTAGVSFGFDAGPGNLFFDARYLTDLGKYRDKNDKDGKYGVRRAKLGLSVGYAFGLGSR
ncbi:MAG: PorT family protein [Chitinispirillales bacterium]|nr:PorT family protein [Chitinispirillales bacterium]